MSTAEECLRAILATLDISDLGNPVIADPIRFSAAIVSAVDLQEKGDFPWPALKHALGSGSTP